MVLSRDDDIINPNTMRLMYLISACRAAEDSDAPPEAIAAMRCCDSQYSCVALDEMDERMRVFEESSVRVYTLPIETNVAVVAKPPRTIIDRMEYFELAEDKCHINVILNSTQECY